MIFQSKRGAKASTHVKLGRTAMSVTCLSEELQYETMDVYIQFDTADPKDGFIDRTKLTLISHIQEPPQKGQKSEKPESSMKVTIGGQLPYKGFIAWFFSNSKNPSEMLPIFANGTVPVKHTVLKNGKIRLDLSSLELPPLPFAG